MKITFAGFVAFTVLSLTACKKTDYCEKPPTKPNTSCALAQSFQTSEDHPGMVSQYRKEFDNKGRVSKVVAGLFTLSLEDSIPLLLKYNGNTVYFVKEQNTADTVIVAQFDGADRLISLAEGNAPNYHFVPATFAYSGGRLSAINIAGNNLKTKYDANGNILEMADPNVDGQDYYFTYDLSVKATNQFYSDAFLGDSYNSLYLAQALGWLPDLEPVNKRIRSRVAISDDYDLFNMELTDHVYDSEGKLLSYQCRYFVHQSLELQRQPKQWKELIEGFKVLFH
jgi:YD repeat-containing protein